MTTLFTFAQSESEDNEYDNCKILKSVKVKGRHYLSIFKKINFKIAYDTIDVDDYFAFCKKNNSYLIYSQKTGKLVTTNLRSYFRVGNATRYYQLLINNNIIWLALNAKLTTLKPTTSLINIVCGTVTNYTNFITQEDDSSKITFEEIDESGVTKIDTTFDVTKLIREKSITFLNNTKRLDYDANFNFKKNLDNSVFYEKLIDGKFNIIKLEIQKTVLKTILVRNIENKYDWANRTNFFSPFIFTQKNLYGYFPLTFYAKYLFLNPLNINYAKFMYPNGKKGWLDINGIEYFDR